MNDAVLAFLSSPVRGACGAKICGVGQIDEIQVCADAGADAIGLNFWPSSKRHVSPATVREWLPRIPSSLARVGVFVNADPDAVSHLLDEGLIHAAQLHGDETPADCALLRRRGHCVFKAIGVRDEASLERLLAYEVDAVVLDAFCPGEYGGSGKTFDWQLALQAKSLLAGTPLILSGGLTSENVATAIARVKPSAVDVASGVERAPGIKSCEKIRAFLAAARSAGMADA